MLRGLKIVDGAEAGAWIAPRLEGGFGGKVMQQIPNGYDACVRIFHPASPVSWAEVARALGRTAHREMQWHRLVGSEDPSATVGSEWLGQTPPIGELDPPTLKVLCDVLAIRTDNPEHCFFGLSTIHAGVEESYPEAVQLRWPGRDFVVFSGPLSAADQLGCESRGATFVLVRGVGPQSPTPNPSRWWSIPPNLIWPANHSWFVASEYDLGSTLVGGSRDLIDAILAASELETWEVERGDSLEADADKIN